MTPAADAPVEVFRRSVTHCIVPRDLAHLYESLVRWFAYDPAIRVVVERREDGDRRRPAGGDAPGGVERREAERRSPAPSLADSGLEIPVSMRRHASRIALVRIMVPVNLTVARQEIATLVDRVVSGDDSAADELRMRTYDSVRGIVSCAVRSGRVATVVDDVYDELRHTAAGEQGYVALNRARERALAK